MTDLVANVDVDAGGETAAVKIYCDEWEVNLRATTSDLLRLYQVDRASWSTRTCLAIGRSAGMPVFWCAEDDTVRILIGHDEETWDIAVTVPLATRTRSRLALRRNSNCRHSCLNNNHRWTICFDDMTVARCSSADNGM